MKRNFKRMVVLAALAALGLAGMAKASPLINIQVLGSTTQAGPYTSDLQVTAGTTIYYEVVAQFAAANTSNINTTRKPNGTQDSINSLPNFTLSGGANGAFVASTAVLALTGGSGASAGTINGSTLSGIRPIGTNGIFTNADSAYVFLTGQFTKGSSTTAINWSLDAGGTGSMRIASTAPTGNVAITPTTEASADPFLHFTPLTFSTASTSIVSLTATVPTGRGASLGSLNITGGNTQYTSDIVKFATPISSGYVQVNTFNPATDKEIYALDVQGATPAQLASIVSDISAVPGLTASTTWSNIGPSSTNALSYLFPADGGTLVYIGADPGVSGTPYFGVNLANNSSLSGVTIAAIAVVPEPASLAGFGIAAAALLMRRRRQ